MERHLRYLLIAAYGKKRGNRLMVRQNEDTDPSPERSIGSARMDEHGIITLFLIAEVPGLGIAHGSLVYKPSDPRYNEILSHLGGLRPGEHKPVRPWPETS